MLSPVTGEILQEKFHLHLPCIRMSVMNTNKNSCFLQNQLESPGPQSPVVAAKCGYEWRYLEQWETAEPTGAGKAAAITAELVGLTATKLWAWCGATSGFYGFNQSSGTTQKSYAGRNVKKNLPHSQSVQPVCPQKICMVEPWGPENSETCETCPSCPRPPAYSTCREPSRWPELTLGSVTFTCREIWVFFILDQTNNKFQMINAFLQAKLRFLKQMQEKLENFRLFYHISLKIWRKKIYFICLGRTDLCENVE